MDKFFGIAQTPDGDALRGVTLYVRDFVTEELISLFQDDGTTPLANPLVSNGDGRFEFCADPCVCDVLLADGTVVFTHVVLRTSSDANAPDVEEET